MRTLTKKLNERISALSKEDYDLLLYCMLFMISWKLDSMHCQLLANYYGCQVADLLSYDKNIWLILLSMIFGIVDLFLGYQIFKLTYHAPTCNVDVTIANGFITSIKIKSFKKLLMYPATYVILISVISILYDLYEILSKFIF